MANLRKLMQEVPRPLEIQAHDDKGSLPLGRKSISRAKATERQGSFLNRLAKGQVPLDGAAADTLRAYLDAHHQRTR